MLNIKLDETYRIKGDTNQYLLVKTTKSKKGLPLEQIEGYFVNLTSLLQNYINEKVRASNVTTFKELVTYQKQLITELNKALEPLNIEILYKLPKNS